MYCGYLFFWGGGLLIVVICDKSKDEEVWMKKASAEVHRNVFLLAVKLDVIRWDLFSICKAWDVAGSVVWSILKNKYKINER